MLVKLYQIDPRDKVAVALCDIPAGTTQTIAGRALVVKEPIPAGHKVAVTNIPKGMEVIKYGYPIGIVQTEIEAGQWVHVHNLRSQADQERKTAYHFSKEQVVMPGTSSLTFQGYRRKNGKTGCRNYILMISGGFCANAHIKEIYQAARTRYPGNEHFDGFLPLTHECGCGQEGEDLVRVRKILAGLLCNANIGAVLFLEIGCENNQLDTILQYAPEFDCSRLRKVTMQLCQNEMEDSLQALGELYEMVCRDERQSCSVSELHVGGQCGGSDGFSGLTANKLVGKCAEAIVSWGGTFNITEVTEMFGAEQILINRAIDAQTAEKINRLLQMHRDYIRKYNGSANGNPSYGNKQGGITTIEDKSLGCIQKGGRCAISDVVFYGERARKHGLLLVQGPGSDLVGGTAQIAAGATLEIFTTGRGTPIAFAAPTLKVATNPSIFKMKRDWMDFNAGSLLQGSSLEMLTEEFLQMVLDTASGRYRTSNERMHFFEMGILRDGVIL